MQRDEDMNDEPKLPVASDYNLKRLEETRVELNRIAEWSTEDIAREAEKEFQERLNSHNKYAHEKVDLRNKYNAMLARVVAWTPPTKEHEGLKDFMLQQIRDSIKWDCIESEPPKLLSLPEWYQNKVNNLEQSLAYHEEENIKEQERTANRTAWIKELYKSLE